MQFNRKGHKELLAKILLNSLLDYNKMFNNNHNRKPCLTKCKDNNK